MPKTSVQARPQADEPIVIRPAMTVPGDLPQKVAEALEELLPLAAGILDISEKIGTTILPAYISVGSGDDEYKALDEATGWMNLQLTLLRLGTALICASGTEADSDSNPSWFVDVEREKWKIMLRDPYVSDTYHKKAWDGLQIDEQQDLEWAENVRVDEARLRQGLPMAAFA